MYVCIYVIIVCLPNSNNNRYEDNRNRFYRYKHFWKSCLKKISSLTDIVLFKFHLISYQEI